MLPTVMIIVILASAILNASAQPVQTSAPTVAGEPGPRETMGSLGSSRAAGRPGSGEITTGTDWNGTGLTIGLNFTASTLFVDSFFVPPDTMGAVGPDHIVEFINGRYSVYRKRDGVRVQTSSLDEFWRAAGVSFRSSTFDPRILFDPFSQRWLASSADNVSADNDFLVAVSKCSDPTAGWIGFAIDSDSTDRRWADFPTLGFDADGVYLSANMFPIPGRGALGVNTTIVAIPKNDLLAAAPTVVHATKFEDIGGRDTGAALQPVVNLDNTGLPAALLSAGSPLPENAFKRLSITGDIASPALDTSGFIIVKPFSARFSANQPGPTQNLEILNGSIIHASVVLRNGALWGVHTVDNGSHAALRWFEIDVARDLLVQEGLIANGELDFYYGSIAVNEFGDIVIGFNGSGESQFVSSYAVLGKTVSGTTIFGEPLRLMAGIADYFQDFGTGRNRWGDYSATVVDPVNPFTFWTFQEFVSGENTWSTQISQLKVVRPVSIAIRPRSEANNINPKSKGRVRVAILSANGFDATTVLPETVRFGPTGTEAAPVDFALRDVDGDGGKDMVVSFLIQDAAIECGQTTAFIRGQTSAGQPIQGSDFIRTVGCRK